MKFRCKESNGKDYYYSSKSDVKKSYFYNHNGVENSIVEIKGTDDLFRGRSEMLVLSEDQTQVYLSFNDNDYDIPGGSWDPKDKGDHQKSAIRETQEETRMNTSDVKYCLSYIKYSDEIKKWVQNNIPKDKQWTGYYTELYIGIYDSKYTKRIAEKDKDDMINTGKFYNISEVYDKLIEFHKDVLKPYLEKSKESVVNEAATVKTVTPEVRSTCEDLIYRTFSAIDPTGANTQYYQQLFSTMSDKQFTDLISGRLPFRYHVTPFENEPKMPDIFKAFKILDKPLMEKIKLPYLAKNENGEPIESKECLVGYLNIKRLKQMLTKKNNTAMEIAKREMKLTGRLQGHDKGGLESIKEFEGALALGLEHTTAEYARVKAASMKAKAEAYNIINSKGEVSFDDIDTDKTDSIAKNALNVYLIGANLHSNLIDEEYYNPHTLDRHARRIDRTDD